MSVGIRHDDLRRRNRAMVISAVRRAGQPSRTEIAATTGLSHSTISAISSDLIHERILTESKAGEAMLGKIGRGVTTRNWATTLKLLALIVVQNPVDDLAGVGRIEHRIVGHRDQMATDTHHRVVARGEVQVGRPAIEHVHQ